jgi:hypothetical protein
MKRRSAYVWVLVLVAGLAAITISPSKSVHAQHGLSAPVTVVNTPLPVTLRKMSDSKDRREILEPGGQNPAVHHVLRSIHRPTSSSPLSLGGNRFR